MKRLLSLLVCLVPLLCNAQAVQFGYLSFQTVMQEMPEYAKAQADLAALRTQYEAEAQRGEEEFQKKFIDFMQGQKDFPTTILQKRQAELQSLMDNGVNFRVQAQDLLRNAEKDLLAQVEKVLRNAILAVGVENGYGIIMNTDDNNCPFINPIVGVDVTDLVRVKLGLIQAPTLPPAAAPAQLPLQTQPVAAPQIATPVQQLQQNAAPANTTENPQEH